MNKKKVLLILYIIFAIATLWFAIRTIAIGGNLGGLGTALMLFVIISISFYCQSKNDDGNGKSNDVKRFRLFGFRLFDIGGRYNKD